MSFEKYVTMAWSHLCNYNWWLQDFLKSPSVPFALKKRKRKKVSQGSARTFKSQRLLAGFQRDIVGLCPAFVTIQYGTLNWEMGVEGNLFPYVLEMKWGDFLKWREKAKEQYVNGVNEAFKWKDIIIRGTFSFRSFCQHNETALCHCNASTCTKGAELHHDG